MNIEDEIRKAGHARTAEALASFVEAFTTPAFGALPKSETDLLVLNLLVELGALSNDPQPYELMRALKVTRAKAQRLLYDRDLRQRSPAELDRAITELLLTVQPSRDGEFYTLNIENPVVAAHLAARVTRLGHVPDGSFNRSVIRLGLNAFVALVESAVPPADRARVHAALVAAGAPGDQLQSALSAVLKRISDQAANRVSGELVSSMADLLRPLLLGSTEALSKLAVPLFIAAM